MEDWFSSSLNRPELDVDLKHAILSLKKADEGILNNLKKL